MSTVIRSANLDTDGELITDFLARYHTPDSDQKRFDWLYRNGPAGQARAWIASDPQTHAMVGVAAAFPRYMYLRNQEDLGWILGDFCIDSRYRSLGPAVQLQRACLAELECHHPAIFYDFPSLTMLAVYRRLGISPDHQMLRLAKPLRLDEKVRSLVKQPQIARVLASTANAGLAIRTRRSRLHEGLSACIHQGPCGNEFTRLARDLGSSFGVCVYRSAEYLNWRYRAHPYRLHEIIALRREGLLVGYAVVRTEGAHLNLVDLLAIREVIPELLNSVLSTALDRKSQSVTVGILASHRSTKLFRDRGFRFREKFPVVIADRSSGMNIDESERDWFLLDGDRES